MYSISLENFSGPLEKLLELIEQKKMDITSISLAEVTQDFISYTQELKRAYEERAAEEGEEGKRTRIYAGLVSDFLVVAAQLVLIKSRTLLPRVAVEADDEGGEYNLERQLQVYSSLKPVFLELKKFWAESGQSFSRDLFRATDPVFYPPASITPETLWASFKEVTHTLGMLMREEQTVQRQLVTLEEKITELSESILKGVQKFSSVAGERTKHEIIVLFLALLHLLRDRTVQVRQEAQFGDIEFSGKDYSESFREETFEDGGAEERLDTARAAEKHGYSHPAS